MEKEENSIQNQKPTSDEVEEKENDNKKSLSPEEKIKDLEDKLSRALAEMENQRRRYEKEKEDAFEYGGFSFAKETLNLIDNLERSKTTIENDNSLKNFRSTRVINTSHY